MEAYPVVYGRVYHRFRSVELAGDATQHAFLKASIECKKSPGFFNNLGYGRFVKWLTTTARRWALDEIRKRRRLPPSPRVPGPDPSPTVWGCWQQLPEPDRQILEWKHYEDLTDAEIGERLVPPVNGQAARRRRLEAMGRLRQCLLAAGMDPVTWEIAPEGPRQGN